MEKRLDRDLSGVTLVVKSFHHKHHPPHSGLTMIASLALMPKSSGECNMTRAPIWLVPGKYSGFSRLITSSRPWSGPARMVSTWWWPELMLAESRMSGGRVILVVRSGGVPVVSSACKGGFILIESVVVDPCTVCEGEEGGSVVSVLSVVDKGVVLVSTTGKC